MPRRMTEEEIIERAKSVHGDKYDYSKVAYTGYREKVVIVCPTHGEFTQSPHSHIRGSGCRLCGGESSGSARRERAAKTFIERARAVHGGLYSYGKSVYRAAKIKVIITCPIHGDFEQNPNNHLSGKGCKSCGHVSTSDSKRIDTAEFITRARGVHGSRYDYANTSFMTSSEKVAILCEKHGQFMQTPNDHLRGRGCPNCHSYTGRTIVYLVHIESHGEEMIKIGITNHEVEQRFSDNLHPDQHVTEIATLEFKDRQDAKTIEAYLHAKHKKHQFTPKVKFGGHTECFNIEALDIIKRDFGV